MGCTLLTFKHLCFVFVPGALAGVKCEESHSSDISHTAAPALSNKTNACDGSLHRAVSPEFFHPRKNKYNSKANQQGTNCTCALQGHSSALAWAEQHWSRRVHHWSVFELLEQGQRQAECHVNTLLHSQAGKK